MKLTKKIMIAGAGVVGAIGIGAAAFAFISTNGSGSGTAAVTSTITPITFADVPELVLVPGVPTAVPAVLASNSNSFAVRLGQLKVTNVVVKKTINSVETILTTTCPVIVSPDTNGPYPLSANSTSTPVPSSLKLTLDDNLIVAGQPVNQNVCLGASVSFSVTADALP